MLKKKHDRTYHLIWSNIYFRLLHNDCLKYINSDTDF